MGREVRRVPENWQHPKDEHGYVPLLNRDEYDERYSEDEYMPDFDEATHWQMYETTTEGTPISPVMETPEKLAQWLAENEASAFADITATYEEWLALCRRGSAVSAVVTPRGVRSGVSVELEIETRLRRK